MKTGSPVKRSSKIPASAQACLREGHRRVGIRLLEADEHTAYVDTHYWVASFRVAGQVRAVHRVPVTIRDAQHVLRNRPRRAYSKLQICAGARITGSRRGTHSIDEEGCRPKVRPTRSSEAPTRIALGVPPEGYIRFASLIACSNASASVGCSSTSADAGLDRRLLPASRESSLKS